MDYVINELYGHCMAVLVGESIRVSIDGIVDILTSSSSYATDTVLSGPISSLMILQLVQSHPTCTVLIDASAYLSLDLVISVSRSDCRLCKIVYHHCIA